MTTPYTRKNYSPDESVGYLMKRAVNQITMTVDRGLGQFDMTHAQFGIFLKLLHGHANTAADLARELMTDTGSMTRCLDRLEEKDFISRTRSNADRRVVEVALTDKGMQLADEMIQVAIHAVNHHLRGFSAEEVSQLKGFLRRVIVNADG